MKTRNFDCHLTQEERMVLVNSRKLRVLTQCEKKEIKRELGYKVDFEEWNDLNVLLGQSFDDNEMSLVA